MPVFINEVVIRANVDRAASAGGDSTAAPAIDRDELIAEVTQAVVDYLERELDRIGER